MNKSGTASFLVLFCSLCGLGQDSIKRGQTQFGQTCAFCHGPDAAGGAEGPNLIRSALVRHDNNGDLIGPVIRDGRPAKGMPPVPLSENQIADVVAYLHSRLSESDRTNPDNPRKYALKLLLTGDPEAGKAFFSGKGNCKRCHSPSGDLAGIAKKYAPADLQARFLYPENVPKTAVVKTRSGREFRGELAYHDQFTIALRDEDGWYHSWPCSTVKFRINDPLAAHLDLLQQYSNADVHNVFAFLETLK